MADDIVIEFQNPPAVELEANVPSVIVEVAEALYTGQGMMDRTVYDPDDDGVVEAADSVPWSGVSGKPSDITNITTLLSGKEATANKGAANGYAPLDANAKIPVANMPAPTTNKTLVVANDTAKAAIDTGTLISGDRVVVIAATDGSTEGWVWDGTAYHKDADTDWANVNIDWANIANKPSTYAATAITLSTTNFNKNLSSADDTVQKALETLDELVAQSASADMTKAVYDTDNDGVVDAAETAAAVPWSGVTDKPTLGTAAALNVPTTGDATSGQVVKGDDTRLSDARTPTAHNHDAAYEDQLGNPTVDGQILSSSMAGVRGWITPSKGIQVGGVTVNAGSSTPTAGSKGFRPIPVDCTLIGWMIIADVAGSIQFDIKKCAYADFPMTTTIVGTETPSMVNSRINKNSSFTGWTTQFSAGDILELLVVGAETLHKVTLYLIIQS